MPYAIAYVVYGIDLTCLEFDNKTAHLAKFERYIQKVCESEAKAGKEEPFHMFYQGGTCFGIVLDQFDETTFRLAKTINFTPTEQQVQDYKDNLAKLLARQDIPKEFAEYMANTAPDVIFEWGTS